MNKAAALRKLRAAFKARGDCGVCGKPVVPGYAQCKNCRARDAKRVSDGRNAIGRAKQNRRPLGWAVGRAGTHRRRVRIHNKKHPDFPLLEHIIDGPSLLASIVSYGPTCGLCGKHAGFPWEHVGDPERGGEVDHILSMWAIINEGRDDWASVSNTRLLCKDCHREEGVRLKRQDIEEQAHMDHMLGKDRT